MKTDKLNETIVTTEYYASLVMGKELLKGKHHLVELPQVIIIGLVQLD